ncbi:hypothetical protein ABS768_10620 [Flavobacterium sp. ST-75]|uniref:YD repeat-containing protein n=1 Tax=Flavobacterium rhizophilum TaxID=3163296 RepID=A0ABW8YCT1_9FLAO
MKKLLAVFSVATLITACSKDDLSSNLTEVVVQKYSNGNRTEIAHYSYSDGKITQIMHYNNSNFRIGKTKYEYYSNGSLLRITKTGTDNFTPIYSYEYIYDEHERIAFKKYRGSQSYNTDYTYNNDNTISALRMVNGGGESTATFYLNSDNLIYKQVSNLEEYTITYNGQNPTLTTNGSNNILYEYDEFHNRLLLNDRNKNNLYLSNNILMADNILDDIDSITDKYLTKETVESGPISSVKKYDYIFNDIGLPTNRKEYHNDILIKETEYIYQ